MSIHQSLISPTANPELRRALSERLQRRAALAGGLGELEPLAIRLGLIQDSLTPRFRDPTVALFVADHGLAVDGLPLMWGRTTKQHADLLLHNRLPCSVLARTQGLQLSLIDCGIAEEMPPNPRLQSRKIAHGTRNSRLGPAMSLEHAHAAVRVGMEIADKFTGNVLVCAGLGQGAFEAGALVMSRLCDLPVKDFIVSGPDMRQDQLDPLLGLLLACQARHREAVDPMDVLAAFGGFETAVMVGAMLVAASKRHLIVVDGLPACAALKAASMIAAPVTDYAVFCRSHTHHGIDQALAQFHAAALLELGLDAADGCGALLAWPMLRAAAAMLTDLHDSADTLMPPPPPPAVRVSGPGRLSSRPGLLGMPGTAGDTES
ncbi:nicotinate-nucleotide--dimethylbenzimidazole phosphoribosyltransferase [Pelomonas sp. APW6]|uniref:Nicotinate-nucleotide--dimethylbenzimidazole phosphoribosyltransferase n=1 Tax=Roseateles subflavus TaxID=3053353 RepID=A0ABT7LIF6_9BURK|nr:nicotinate-nucleotide--dimethylbenzimidazole phosphoribosyltransferase [Pelomonas sp. APW6]MDL5032656.1 nicotinate-nucleotide--dimethylbenzimidazole phosphoribosyltransferase [Pelomonas sp. APW6]